jgi:lactoylglutathione lyase
MSLKFVHTNLVAKDWKSLADFYIKVFECHPKPPERDLQGQWLDQATNLNNAHIRGVHLVLPGYPDDPLTLEIFQYSEELPEQLKVVNRPGFGHIAFAVDDVAKILAEVIENGGGRVGELVATDIDGAGWINFVYARDPEGNIIEIQKWN